jgi:eukaryotic-like serine/threonine-protein kinase
VSLPPAPRPDPAFLALQAALAGRFSLEREIGRGGMGIVYLARDVLLERPVAIKLLAPTLGAREAMRRRFLREARTAAQCFHPHIVPIHEVAESGELAWFVMAYVQGETLADRLRRSGPLPPDLVQRIGREVGWALGYAHERGVVHRDVKPENILIEKDTGRALIADFGIAQQVHGPEVSGEVAGTARFMAPEQALGDTLDGRADLYALGVTLYLAATGRYPVDGQSAMAIVAQQAVSRPPAVRTFAPQLPSALADAIDQCLAPMAGERFATAAHFVSALDREPPAREEHPTLRETRQAAQSSATLLDWTLTLSLVGFFLILGEEAGSLSRGIMKAVVESVLVFASVATVVRSAELPLLVRRALREGNTQEDVAQALATPAAPPVRATPALQAVALLLVGAALAYAQGTMDSLAMPKVVEFLSALATWLAPPVLVQRGLAGLRRSTGLGAWLQRVVRVPAARWLTARLAPANVSAPSLPASAPTEWQLGNEAGAILARLGPDTQVQLAALPAATVALAEEAAALRARAHHLSDEMRALRNDTALRPDARTRQVAALDAERQRVQARLGTTVAALESIRLDLLRLESEHAASGNLTEHLAVVQDLHRRVEAMSDVERALRPRVPLKPEPTPV